MRLIPLPIQKHPMMVCNGPNSRTESVTSNGCTLVLDLDDFSIYVKKSNVGIMGFIEMKYSGFN